MTPKQADKLIASGQPVTVHNSDYDETFTATFVSRDRYSITSDTGGIFDRSDLEVVVLPTTTLCCWCDEPATAEPVRYAGTNHPACPVHSAEYS